MSAYRRPSETPLPTRMRPPRSILLDRASAAIGIGALIIPVNFFVWMASYEHARQEPGVMVPFGLLAAAQTILGIAGLVLALTHAIGIGTRIGGTNRVESVLLALMGWAVAVGGTLGGSFGAVTTRHF